MQSIGKCSAASVRYYTEQLPHSVGEDVPVLRGGPANRGVDYYADHEAPARWMGSCLEAAGVDPATPVSKEAFARLMGHETLTGVSMTRARAAHGSVAAFDHTFSAPKSVSLLYAFGDSQISHQVREAHLEAVRQSVEFMEANCAQARVGHRWRDEAGRWHVSTTNVDSDGWVAAAFDHFTSRANDPQLHTHVVVINRVHTEDGWRALDARRNYLYAKAGGTVYEAVLRDELSRRLGLSWGPVVNGIADIEGFSPELIQHFSTRRTEILEAAEAYAARNEGELHARMLQKFTLETRQPKQHPRGEALVTREMRDYGVGRDVLAHWQARAVDAPQNPLEVIGHVLCANQDGVSITTEAPSASERRILEKVVDRQAVFTERDLVVEVAASFPAGAPSRQIAATTKQGLEAGLESGELVPLPGQKTGHRWSLPEETQFTTRSQLEREQRVLAAVHEASPVKVDLERVEQAAKVRELTPEQTRALRHLVELDGCLVAVAGPGGSGKTYAMGAYADAAYSGGHHVIGVAPTATAAQRLAGDLGGHWTGTVAMLTHHLDRIEEALLAGTLVICDEASMVSTKDVARLVEIVRNCDGKLILLGDPQQLPSIDSGGLFHRIVGDGHGVVTDLAMVNQRQRHDLDRQALQLLRFGRVDKAVLDYTEAGRVHIGRERLDTMMAMVDAWWKDTRSHDIESVRMLAGRRSDIEMLNQLARSRAETEGLLTGPPLETRMGLRLQAGDRIVVKTNWYTHNDLRNGQTGTVTAVDLGTGGLSFRRDHDGVEVVLPKRYVAQSVDYGYAQTIHTAQGHTYEQAHVYVDQAMTAEHGYTGLSRARGETHIWTADGPGPLGDCIHAHYPPAVEDRTGTLVRQFSRSGARHTASDHYPTFHQTSDQNLLDRRDELAHVISRSSFAQPKRDISAFDAAIADAKAVLADIGTSGARRLLGDLEAQRRDALVDVAKGEEWLVNNAGLIRKYQEVNVKIDRRVAARCLLYQSNPPDDLLEILGARATAPDPKAWDNAVTAYARARIEVGSEMDLNDSAVPRTGPWRDAVRQLDPSHHDAPVLRLSR
jgi:conjugative relaxase-like TrwC/TraI family protein